MASDFYRKYDDEPAAVQPGEYVRRPSDGRGGGRSSSAAADAAISGGTQALLLSQQYPDGYWWAELDGNVSLTAQTILLYKILAIDRHYPLHKMEAHLRRQLRRRPKAPSHSASSSSSAAATAYWELSYGDGGNLSVSIEAYIALRLLGTPKSDPDVADSLPFILSRGGASASRIFTKLCLALLGCFHWRGIPTLPPWFMLFPPSFPTSIYEMSCWARACVVPLFVVFDKKPVFPVRIGSDAAPTFANFDELFIEGSSRHANVLPSFSGNNGDWRADFFVALDYTLKNPTAAAAGGWAFEFFNRWYPDVDDSAVVVMALDAVDLPDNTVKRGAMARAVAWIASLQCKAGGW